MSSHYGRIIAAILLSCLCVVPISAQIDFTRYFDETSLPLLDATDHLDPHFKWDMPGNIQVFMNEGINDLKEGELHLAITNFDEVLKLDSMAWVAYYYRGICYKNLFQLEPAEKNFQRAKKIQPDEAATYVELGEIYHLNKSFDKATKEYEKAIAVDPLMVQAYYNLACVMLMKGDSKKSLRYFEKCNEVNPKFPQAFMMQGIMKFRVTKRDNASITLFDKAVAADPTYTLPYFWRGLAYIGLNQPREALKSWNTLIELEPENAHYILMRGCLYIELEDFDNAFNDLRKAMRSVAVDEERFIGGQTILDKKIDLQYAANYLITTGYGLDERAFGLLKKGYCLILGGRYKAALEIIRKSEEVQPSATVYFIEALAYEHSGDHKSAFKCYNQALELDNDIFDAHKKRSIYRIELQDWKGADADFNAMFRLQPKSPTTYRLRGLARSHQKNFKGAIEDLTNFLKTDSSDYEALRTRAVCLNFIGDDKRANEDLRKMLKLTTDWDLYETVAENYLTLKDTANAIAIWKEYTVLAPGLSTPRLALARIYASQKNWESLRHETDKLLPMINPDVSPVLFAEVVYLDGLIAYWGANYETAIIRFSKSLKANSNNVAAKYLRALAYEKTGQFKRAVIDFKDLKAMGYKDSEARYNALKML